MGSSYRVIVVDDDFMIAKMHGKFIASQTGYELVGTACNYEQALSQVTELSPDLLLLDVYLPDHSGIDLVRTIRSRNLPCDIILITAAKEREIVEEGFRLGIFDYLFKPFDLDHLQSTLIKYAQFKTRLSSSDQWNQESLDNLKKLRAPDATTNPFQKGIDIRTLERIKQYLLESSEFQNVDQIAQRAGVSRSTVRNYMTYLVEEHIVEELLQYGTIGRPQRLYRMKA
ncbi:two-component system, CitB family, response regulator [Paenibacillus sp. yr247]|uniref:response regulator n=1 Tax=Paenibacillus sp. yr247 TaxID=1761880 RepID=UPI00088677DC|nr:response regulator [Paenibacillus sp. yr247]SDM82187.1 two-component system, CitB family, response regulator [Paenibacillus sp. yr247]